jgi:hypothetical protein
MLLKVVHDFKQIAGVWVALWAKHPHQALGGMPCCVSQFLKADGSIDVVTKHSFAGIHVSSQQALDAFAQQFSAKGGVTLRAGLNGQFEVSRQCHLMVSLVSSGLIVLPTGYGVSDVLLLTLLAPSAQ